MVADRALALGLGDDAVHVDLSDRRRVPRDDLADLVGDALFERRRDLDVVARDQDLGWWQIPTTRFVTTTTHNEQNFEPRGPARRSGARQRG